MRQHRHRRPALLRPLRCHHLQQGETIGLLPAARQRLSLRPEQARLRSRRKVDREIGVGGGTGLGDGGERRDVARIVACQAAAQRVLAMQSLERMPDRIVEDVEVMARGASWSMLPLIN